ncbi:MAG TPA: ABC transporter substrate-binding protein, partial [Rhizomicrobium sp.]|nr:ABC transporter substrate-binding protein [Rhizomicrobium sp.]
MIDAVRPKASWARLFAILGLTAIAALSGCTPPPPPPPKVVAPPPPVAGNPVDRDLPSYLRLPNTPPGITPLRVGVILPFSSTNPGTRNLAAAMLKSAALALFDGGNSNILLITADEGAGPDTAGAAAVKLLGQGAEIIVGPLFGPSVAAVAPVARDRGIPVLAFSTERSVAGNGVYLLSFLPQSEVKRVVNYAVAQGHHNFAAMVPQ